MVSTDFGSPVLARLFNGHSHACVVHRPGITDYSAIFLLAQKLKKLIGLIVLLAAAYTADYAQGA